MRNILFFLLIPVSSMHSEEKKSPESTFVQLLEEFRRARGLPSLTPQDREIALRWGKRVADRFQAPKTIHQPR